MIPIPRAKVRLMGIDQETDASGVAVFNCKEESLTETIFVQANEYRPRGQICNVRPKDYCYIVMEHKEEPNRPYISMVSTVTDEGYCDLLTQSVHYKMFEERECNIKLTGDWAGRPEGKYVMYQEASRCELRFCDEEFTFQPGIAFRADEPIFLKMISADNKESDPVELKITIGETRLFSNGEEYPTEMNLYKNFGGMLVGDIPDFLPQVINCSLESIPISTQIEIENDGKKTVRMAIGVATINNDGGSWSKEDWNKYKQEAENLLKYMEFPKSFANRRCLLSEKYKMASDWQLSVNITGYYEIVLDKNDNIIDQGGGAILTCSDKYEKTFQTFVYFVPVYYGFTFEPVAKANLGLHYADNKLQLKFDLDIGAALLGHTGFGVKKLLSAGVEGGLNANLHIPFAEIDHTNFKVGVQLSLQAEVLFLFKWEHKLISADLFRLGQKGESWMDVPSDKIGFELDSRAYARKTSRWNGTLKNKRPINESPGQKEVVVDYMSTIQEWIMPNSMPQIVQYNDQQVMVFLENSLNREAENGLVLKYSVFENGVWRDPEPVWDTGTSDLYAELKVINQDLYVIWQKQKGKLTSGIPVEQQIVEAASMSEICVAKFDGKTFCDGKYITHNDTIDTSPSLVELDGRAMAVWLNCDNNDLMSEGGTYRIMTSDMEDGLSWTNPRVNFETSSIAINELDATFINGHLDIAISGTEMSKTCIYRIIDGCITEVPESLGGSSLQYCDNMLYWYLDGVLFEFDPGTGYLSDPINPGGNNSITLSYKILNNDKKKAIAWTGVSDGQYGLFVSVMTGGAWGDPIKVLELNEGSVRYMDVVLTEMGEWKFIMNTSNGEIENGAMHSLVYASVSERSDVSLNYLEASDYDRVDGIQPITYEVANTSESTITNYNIKVYSNTEVYFDGNVKCDILAGSSELNTLEINMPELNKLTNISVMISAHGDTDMTNNCKSIELGKTDLSLESKTYSYNGITVIASKVSNTSNTPSNATVRIVEDEKSAKPTASSKSALITTNESRLYIFLLDENAVDYGPTGAKAIFTVLNSTVPDYNSTNDSNIVTLYGKEIAKCNTDVNRLIENDDIRLETCVISTIIIDNREQRKIFRNRNDIR